MVRQPSRYPAAPDSQAGARKAPAPLSQTALHQDYSVRSLTLPHLLRRNRPPRRTDAPYLALRAAQSEVPVKRFRSALRVPHPGRTGARHWLSARRDGIGTRGCPSAGSDATRCERTSAWVPTSRGFG